MLCIMHQLEGKPIWNTSFLSCFFLFRSSSYYCSLLGSQAKEQSTDSNPRPMEASFTGKPSSVTAAESSLPHEALRELSLKYGPLMHLQLGEISTVVVSSRDTAKEIMKTHDLAFVERPQVSPVGNIFTYGGTDVAFAPYGDYWRQMGKIFILELLSAKKVQSFSYVREDEVAINDVFR